MRQTISNINGTRTNRLLSYMIMMNGFMVIVQVNWLPLSVHLSWCLMCCYRKRDELIKLNSRMLWEAVMLTYGRWYRSVVLPCQKMEQCCRPRAVVIALLALEIVLLSFTVFMSIDHGRRQSLLHTTSTPSDISVVDYDNDTADEFLANYSIYCEKFLIPKVFNTHHDRRRTPLCPCIPNDLGMWHYETFINNTLCLKKKQDTKLLPITSPDVNRFSKFFHWQTHW